VVNLAATMVMKLGVISLFMHVNNERIINNNQKKNKGEVWYLA